MRCLSHIFGVLQICVIELELQRAMTILYGRKSLRPTLHRMLKHAGTLLLLVAQRIKPPSVARTAEADGFDWNPWLSPVDWLG